MNKTELKGPHVIPSRLFVTNLPWTVLDPATVLYVPCILCGSGRYDVLASLVINRTEFFIVKCPLCGLVWRNPIPDKKFLHDLYSEKYYNVAAHTPDLVYQVGIEDAAPDAQNMRRDITRKEVTSWITAGCSPDANGVPSKFLEIGGGSGYLQQAAKERGWDTLGLEISPHGIREAIAKGLTVLPVPLDDLCDKYMPYSSYFDMVVFFDFLEHVVDPCRVLRMVHHILKDDGIAVLRVPVSDQSPSLHLIDHIWHFSRSTLQLLLKKENFNILTLADSGQFRDSAGRTLDNVTLHIQKVQC